MGLSFSSKVLDWFAQPEDVVLAAELLESCDDAWSSGDRGDQDAVMRFVFFRKDPAGFHFLIDGLMSSHSLVATQAIGFVASLAAEGFNFDQTDRRILMNYATLYPEMRSLVEYVLRLLEKRQG